MANGKAMRSTNQVLHHALCMRCATDNGTPAGGAGLDLAGGQAHCQVRNEAVLSLA
jgi:hypothetical protein